MTEFRYGPVELYLVGFDGEFPSPGVLAALKDVLDTGLVRLLDFVLVTKAEDGTVDSVEVSEDQTGLGYTISVTTGLIGTEDVETFSEHLEPGTSAALVALELSYARTLAEQLATSGGDVLRSERIPAPVVNALLDLAEQEEGN